MAFSLGERLAHAWDAFKTRDPTLHGTDIGAGYWTRPDRVRMNLGNDRSIVASIYNRIALDVAEVTIQHIRTDDNGKFMDVINDGLNKCLNFQANIDQSGKAFMMDVVLSMLDEGVVAIVPVETEIDPNTSTGYEVHSLRTGKIVEWYPQHVKVNVYNDKTGLKEDLVLRKSFVAIVENPFYSVMNEPNSTLRRLIYKMNLLDAIDEQSGSGKLDLIIQLPYIIKSDARKREAEERRKTIEQQLAGSKYGIAYTDGTERITQLNRPVENNLMNQIEFLTSMLYGQLGLTQSIFDGTASPEVMANYMSRTIQPIVSAIALEMKRKFLSKTAITRNESIFCFQDPFRFIPVTQIAEISDKFTRNEIMTTNEFRQVIGMKTVTNDPRADQLLNKNLSYKDGGAAQAPPIETKGNQNGGG